MPLLFVTMERRWPQVEMTSDVKAALANFSGDVSAVNFSRVPGLVSRATMFVVTEKPPSQSEKAMRFFKIILVKHTSVFKAHRARVFNNETGSEYYVELETRYLVSSTTKKDMPLANCARVHYPSV